MKKLLSIFPLAIVFLALSACGGGGTADNHDDHDHGDGEAHYHLSDLSTDKDVVCGMTLHADEDIKATTEHDGKTYGFCAEGCKEAFEADPSKYLAMGDNANEGEGDDDPMIEVDTEEGEVNMDMGDTEVNVTEEGVEVHKDDSH